MEIDYTNIKCNPRKGGTPQCKLPLIRNKFEANGAIEVQGMRASSIAQLRAGNAVEPEVYREGDFDLFIISESPGAVETKTGVAFSGESSNYLFKFLEQSHLNLDRVFLTYIVKCLGPKGRKPAAPEIRACMNHLERDLRAYKPPVVMCLGNLALKSFKLDKEGGITTVRGKVFEKHFVNWEDGPLFKIIPSINPTAYTLRQEGIELNKTLDRTSRDYQLAKGVIEGKKEAEQYVPNWTLIDTNAKLDEMVRVIKERKLFSFDTESCDNRFMKSDLICLSFAWGKSDECAVLPWHMHDAKEEKLTKKHFDEVWLKPGYGLLNKDYVLSKLKEIFEDPTIAKIAHNIKYDVNVMLARLGIKVKGFFYDPMTMHHLLDELPPHALAYLANNELGVGDYEALVKAITGKGKTLVQRFDKIPDHLIWPYTATDAECTFRICLCFYERMQAKPHLWKLYLEESEPGMHALAVAEFKGSLMDKQIAEYLKKEQIDKQHALLSEMRRTLRPDFKPSSPDHVIEAFKQLGLEDKIIDKKKAKGYTTDQKRLGELEDVPLAKNILAYRTSVKMVSTYHNKALFDTDDDGRIRHGFKQHGAVTGRLSASFVHQIPKVDERRVLDETGKYLQAKNRLDKLVMRDMFVSPPGYTYIHGDYSQVELRILAIIAQDEELKRVFREGDDLHAISTAEILSSVWEGYTEEMAKKDKFNRAEVGKRVNFGLAYGSKGHSLVKTGKWRDAEGNIRTFSWDMLNQGMENWNARFAGVGAYLKDKPDEVRDHFDCIAISCFGRERRFGRQLLSDDEYQRAAAERELVNFFIQSPAGGITNRTINKMHVILEKLIDNGSLKPDDVYLVNTVHDSIAYECRDELVPWFIPIFHKIATRSIPELDNESFPFDLGIGRSWTESEMNEIDIEEFKEAA